MNVRMPARKVSRIEKLVNQFMLAALGLLLVLVIVSTVLSYVLEKSDFDEDLV
jgi:hypothetical protein